ncbi:kazrin-A-like isoform X1 [Alosa alosa]|uniref:kazrin-A-like isoform X1 n=1 Tax=Alosa alosa TaxID=278164 RepID=UPI00201530B8|nr:kazrin-A-like isoform X1 [Alosa alosa]
MEQTLTCPDATFSQVFGRQGQLMQATVQSLNSLNDQIAHLMLRRPHSLDQEQTAFLPSERQSLHQSMSLMRHLLMDAQTKILKMMEDNKQLAQRIDAAVQSASQEVSNLRSELTATSRRLAQLGAAETAATPPADNSPTHISHDSLGHARQKPVTDLCYRSDISSFMDFGSPDASLDKVLLREEVVQLQEEVSLLKQMKEMLGKDLEETHGGSADLLSATELRVQLTHKEQELDRAREALQAMKADRKRLKVEKADLVNQMQQLYTTLESREEQLRDFIRNYEQHRKESEDAVKTLAKEKDQLEREKWDLRRQAKEATEHAGILRSQLDLRENRIKELEAELAMMGSVMAQRVESRALSRSVERQCQGSPRAMSVRRAQTDNPSPSSDWLNWWFVPPLAPMAKQSLATLTKDVPKRHSLAMPTEAVVNGNQEWVMHADLPLTAAIRQSQQTLYHAHTHTMDRPVLKAAPPVCMCEADGVLIPASAAVRVSPCHSRQPSVISDASAMEADRSSTPSDINSPRHRTHSLCNSLEDLDEQKRKKKKEKMGLGSLSRVFARGKQRKSMDPGLFDGTGTPDYYIEEDADW